MKASHTHNKKPVQRTPAKDKVMTLSKLPRFFTTPVSEGVGAANKLSGTAGEPMVGCTSSKACWVRWKKRCRNLQASLFFFPSPFFFLCAPECRFLSAPGVGVGGLRHCQAQLTRGAEMGVIGGFGRKEEGAKIRCLSKKKKN